jgi:hypothetical protein
VERWRYSEGERGGVFNPRSAWPPRNRMRGILGYLREALVAPASWVSLAA